MKKELNIFEYIFWWILRFSMVAALIYRNNEEPGSMVVLMLSLNLLATFAVPIMRLLLFPKAFFGKLPFRCQTWLNLLIVFASFLSHGFNFNHDVTSWDKILHTMAGFFLLLIGNEIAEPLMRKGDRASNGFKILTATGFSFFAIVAWEIYEFIVDYNWPGSINMAYNLDPDRDPFILMLFGGRSANFEAGFSAVFDTVIDMLCAVAGAIPAIIFLYFYLKAKDKKAGVSPVPKEEKVRYGGIKAFFKSEINALREGVTTAEYIFWWVLRIGQTVMLIYRYKLNGPGSVTVLIMTLNLIATFAVPLVRLLLFPKRIFTKVPFRCQSWINLIIVFASFLGHGFNWSYSVTSWDKILHVMMGSVALLIGNELIVHFLRKGDRVSPLLRTLNATGFSFFAIVIWEVYEFIIDYYWPESGNMAYRMPENDPSVQDPFFVWLYGGPSPNFESGLASLFDTLTDMICAVGGIIPVMIGLYLFLRHKENKELMKAEKETATL